MSELIPVTIDDKSIRVVPGTLIVDAAKKMGIDIPVFCYHPKLEPAGNCRMCLVEIGRPVRDRATGELVLEENGTPKIQFGPKLETACTVPVSDGMVIRTNSSTVIDSRRDVIEFLLTSHPLDCPVCDKGGECPLQELTLLHGAGQSRFIYSEKIHLEKHVPLGDLIYLDRERCIFCARCIRFQDEIAGDPVIQFDQRGRKTEIITSSKPGFASYFSGNTTDICPVGALTTTDFRFGARAWELTPVASICPHCSVGCNLTLGVRREAKSSGKHVVKRVLPRQNEQVNEIWICDKGRFGYHYALSDDRMTEPMIRKEGKLVPSSWDEALDVITERFQDAGNSLFTLVGGHLANEDLFNLRKLTDRQDGTSALYTDMAGGDLTSEVGVGSGTDFGSIGAETAVLVIASDLEEEAPIWWLRIKQAADRGAKIIVANPRSTKLERVAAVILHYQYGEETQVVGSMIHASSRKRVNIGTHKLSKELQAKIKTAGQIFQQAENAMVLFGSEGIGLDASKALSLACKNLVVATGHFGKPNNGLLGIWHHANTQGAWDMGFHPVDDLGQKFKSSKAVYMVGVDPIGDDMNLAEPLSEAGFIVVQDFFRTDTAKLADVVLPALPFTEREGTFTSGDRRVQRFYQAIPPLNGCKSDFSIAAEIGERMDIELEAHQPDRIMVQISQEKEPYAGLRYEKLAQVENLWPVLGGKNIYFGGTAFHNHQGIGVQLPSASELGKSVDLVPLDMDDRTPPTEETKFLAVPVTLLYDQGSLITHSDVLRPRLPSKHVILNKNDSNKLGIDEHMKIFNVNGTGAWDVGVRLDEDIPEGVVLVPRSLGFSISDPCLVTIEAEE